MATLGSGAHTYEVSGENWGSLPEGWSYKEATAVAVDESDNVYVFNRGGHPIIVFDREGNFLRSWGEGEFPSPHGVAIGPDDSVYCADTRDNTVRKFTLDGKLLLTLGSSGRPAPIWSGDPLNKPTHMAVDWRDGSLYVADGYGNARVHKYTADGKLLFSWGEPGTDKGQFNVVHNISTDKDGWVYVADRDNRRVQIFDSNGKYEAMWNSLSRAAAIHVDTRNDQLVYVGEYFAGAGYNDPPVGLGPRVSIFDTSGHLVARLGDEPFGDEPGRFYSPHGISVDSRGDIYVAEVSWSEFNMVTEPPRELRSMQKLVRKS
jgi:DNA-binding beta-propeller fold protein YncE